MMRVENIISKAQLILMLSFGVCVTALALTPAGTIIYNRAEISYQIADTNEEVQGTSNRTSVSVGHLYSFAVENIHTVEVAAGDAVSFPHRIINQGNTEDSYSFSFTDLDSDSFTDPLVYLDSNSNGSADPGEPAIEDTGIVDSLASVDVVITAIVSHLLSHRSQIARAV